MKVEGSERFAYEVSSIWVSPNLRPNCPPLLVHIPLSNHPSQNRPNFILFSLLLKDLFPQTTLFFNCTRLEEAFSPVSSRAVEIESEREQEEGRGSVIFLFAKAFVSSVLTVTCGL